MTGAYHAESKNGEDDPSGLEPHPVHCDVPEPDVNWFDDTLGGGFKERLTFQGVTRQVLRHVDRWFSYDPTVPYTRLGFDNRHGRGRPRGVDNGNG